MRGEQRQRRRALHAPRFPQEQERDEVRECDLRQHIDQVDHRPVRLNGSRDESEEDQKRRPLQHVQQTARPRLARRPAPREGERHHRAHDEHEERLDQVPEVHAGGNRDVPVGVPELVSQRDLEREHSEALADHADHGEAAKGVQ